MSNYVVTGCAGLIGSNVSRILISQGHSVIGIDSLDKSCDIRLKEWRLSQILKNANFDFQVTDICDLKKLKHIFNDKIEGVINLAARAGVRGSVKDPWDYYQTNVIGTINLLELCKEFNIRRNSRYKLSTFSIFSLQKKPQRPFVIPITIYIILT